MDEIFLFDYFPFSLYLSICILFVSLVPYPFKFSHFLISHFAIDSGDIGNGCELSDFEFHIGSSDLTHIQNKCSMTLCVATKLDVSWPCFK